MTKLKILNKIIVDLHSFNHRKFPTVLANSMPKAGTNLLIRLLGLLNFHPYGRYVDIGPNEGLSYIDSHQLEFLEKKLFTLKPGLFTKSHIYYFPEIEELLQKLQIKTITIIRDPRDVCVSDFFYILKNPNHRLHSFYKKLTQAEQLMASIKGIPSEKLNGSPDSLDIGSHYKYYKGWVNKSAGVVIKFEDLIGEKGGGSREDQKNTVIKIIKYLGIELPDRKLKFVCSKVFWPNARTFRKGQVGGWKDYFRPDHLEAFYNVMGDMMNFFGYKD